jgi:predicted DNA-binding protein
VLHGFPDGGVNVSSTTTIRLPADLRARVLAAAKRAGTTPHGFILDAIAEKTADAELRLEFAAEAERRYAAMVSSGKTVPWKAMRKYLEDRLQRRRSRRPAARKLAR